VNQRIKTFHVSGLLALALLGEARAGPLEDAEAAYQRRDYATTLQILGPMADQGDAYAQYEVGVIYFGGQGAPQDFAKAAAWFRKAAEQGNASGQINLGVMYEHGLGLQQDYAQAVAWFRKAADHGDASAQHNLGVMYRDGQGVPQDCAQAVAWFRKAAVQGLAVARSPSGCRNKASRKTSRRRSRGTARRRQGEAPLGTGERKGCALPVRGDPARDRTEPLGRAQRRQTRAALTTGHGLLGALLGTAFRTLGDSFAGRIALGERSALVRAQAGFRHVDERGVAADASVQPDVWFERHWYVDACCLTYGLQRERDPKLEVFGNRTRRIKPKWNPGDSEPAVAILDREMAAVVVTKPHALTLSHLANCAKPRNEQIDVVAAPFPGSRSPSRVMLWAKAERGGLRDEPSVSGRSPRNLPYNVKQLLRPHLVEFCQIALNGCPYPISYRLRQGRLRRSGAG
jgi:Sel1 repeat